MLQCIQDRQNSRVGALALHSGGKTVEHVQLRRLRENADQIKRLSQVGDKEVAAARTRQYGRYRIGPEAIGIRLDDSADTRSRGPCLNKTLVRGNSRQIKHEAACLCRRNLPCAVERFMRQCRSLSRHGLV